ncbi:MAG: class I mannose-6-phosphate isomerase [Bacteroidales bacterium]|nr:class I mannose-6-phosphate isomerase [Bacteroidales bacterium]MBN2699028.1 class I mannose-6-phosphate isomerase [Bacteroidales bacterium]
MRMKSNFNKRPFVAVKGMEHACREGWDQVAEEIRLYLQKRPGARKRIVVETYQGTFYEELLEKLKSIIKPGLCLDTSGMLLKESEIRRITRPDVTDDRIFGYMTRLRMTDLLDPDKLAEYRNLADGGAQTVLIFGYGAALVVPDPDLFIYADMARWEIQLRMRAGKVDNLGIRNRDEGIEKQYKRGFFVDWRICDRLKKETFSEWDYVLDTNDPEMPKLVSAAAFRQGLEQAASQPFSVVPFFDPGPWGGQWMKDKFDLDREVENFAWCFNCIPEENSLLLGFGDTRFETPSINLVFFQSRKLLGDPVHARFGDEFPIRFDYLDTMQGGNLSLQVHPLTAYIQERFGMHYTQDESYYLLDAGEGGSVFLGLKQGVNPDEMKKELKYAEANGTSFDVHKHVQNWPAKKHDHFLIPAGTVHCSGANSMVLEISATPYIFTFKLYDWQRMNLDGTPRPINVDHGLNNIQWERTTEWTRKNLVNRVETIAEGDGWTEERTGLHEREFIETRRHWFTKEVLHDTRDGVNVLTLVEGEEIVVKSPGNAFDPFVVHYAETFIVPAAVGQYTIQPHGASAGKQCATVRASIRV